MTADAREVPTIVRLGPDDLEKLGDELVALLQDTVASGGGIGFLAPVARETARAYWQTVWADVARGERIVVGLRVGDALVGVVQLALATRETGLHRAEVQKLMVRPAARRQGHATRLMLAIEEEARRAGRTLLLLDTFVGSDGDALYTKLGWTRVGEIPGYALRPHRAMGDLALFYKRL